MHAILAARSDFSIGESILGIEELIKGAQAAGATTVALTDTMSATGLIDFTGKAKKAGIKPIVGARLRLVDDPAWRKVKGEKSKTPPEYYLTWYCLSEKGLKALFRLLTLANSDDRFYFTAKLGFDDLYEALADVSADDVALASSDVYSVLHHKDAATILAKIAALTDARSIFLTLTPINTPLFDTLNVKALRLAHDLGLPTLVTRPVHYAPGDADAHEIMGAVTSNTPLSSVFHKASWFRDLHPLTNEDLKKEVAAAARRSLKRDPTISTHLWIAGLTNTDKLVERVTYEWSKAPVSLPKMADDEFAAVVAECKKGWSTRFSREVFGHKPTEEELKDVYRPRLTYELSVLRRLNFSGYFLLVQDVVSFAKSSGILVGPGRGSVGGSLVAYLMGITECDPLRFGLLFERFINPDRIDLPDADLDFMSERRHEIVQYLIEKYGKERVAGVSNFITLGPASAIRDVSKAFGRDESEYRCSKLMPKKHGAHVPLAEAAEQVAEIGQFRDKFKPIWDTCLKLEGVMKTVGQHAAGMVVGGCDLVERAVIERRKGEAVVNWDKRIVEDQGLVKMDILGLSTLDLIDLTLNYIRKRHSKKINLMAIRLDDERVLENFAKANTTGIFQFESGGMRRLLKELGKDGVITFDDITAATALYRPGPMESGMMDSFYRRKQGIEPIEYDHELMESILKPTFGVIVYQEQVMEISRVIAGYSAPDADKLRKIMGKKLPEEMAKERDKFVAGVVKTIGEDEDWAGALFDKIEGFAGYGFNKSHSVEYTLISYQSMFLKTYYAVEFFAAALTLMKEDKLPAILKDAERQGIKIDFPEANTATHEFEILNDARLMIPFSAVKGMSMSAAKHIVQCRNEGGKFKSKEDFATRCRSRLVHKGKVEALDKIGAFAAIEPTQLPSDAPSRILDQRELIPGLVATVVPVNREIAVDTAQKTALGKVHMLMHKLVAADGIPVRPLVGKNARFMVIFDAPSPAEEQKNMMMLSDKWSQPFAHERVFASLEECGLSINDIYWTALIKRPKAGKQVSPEEIKLYWPFLVKEIAVTKPPVIVLLGSTTVRQFIPDFKGKASDSAGQIVYDKGLDANLIVGFSPGEIYHDPDKQVALDEVFKQAQSLVE